MTPLDTFLTSEPIESFFRWLQYPGIAILVTCFLAWLVYHGVEHAVASFFRHAIRKTHFNHQTEADIEKRQKTVAGLVSTMLRVLVWIIAFMVVLKLLFPHINFTPIFASAGIIGVALGFGAQSLVKDFLTGVFIITENQYRVGDVVEIEGAAGTVEHVGIRSTVIRDTSGNVHYLPNGSITHVINKTMGFSKVNFTLSVNPDTDIDQLTNVINDTGKAIAEDPKWKHKITEAPHFANITGFSQLGMDVLVIGTTEPSEQWSVAGELKRRLLKELAAAKIKLAALPPMWNPSPKKK